MSDAGAVRARTDVSPAPLLPGLLTLVALVLSVPLWAGGTPPAARAVLTCAVALLLAVEGLSRIARGVPLDRREVAWLAPWLAFSLVLVLQIAPLPGAVLAGLGAHPETFRELAGGSLQRISPNPVATTATWAIFSSYWLLAFTASRLSRGPLRVLMLTFLGLALFQSAYGLQALLHGSESVLGLWARSYPQDATGTFINRNQFAALLALLWPLLLAWLRADPEQGGIRAPRALRDAAALLVSVLLGGALLSSHSRFGLVAACVGLAIWFTLERRANPRATTRRAWLFWLAAGATLVGGVWLGGERLIERLLQLTESQDRLWIWASALRLPWQTWVLGAGAGSFGDVFKTVHPPELRNSYQHAHSDWLELLVEVGVLGSLALGVAFAFWLRRVRPRRLTVLQRGAVAGVAAMAFHCAADFDLHVPGAALPFWVVLGVAVGREGTAARNPDRRRRKRTLIVELWGLGDGAIASTALAALAPTGRQLYVLCKPATRALLAPSHPGVEFVELTAPWTAFSGKYRLWQWPWREVGRTLGVLRACHFDEAVSVRPDPRDHLLMKLVGARRCCGFPRAGSGLLLDAPVRRAPRTRHKVEDWRVLTARLTARAVRDAAPGLEAGRHGEGAGIDTTDPVWVLHAGAGHPVRRWPSGSWTQLVRRLREHFVFHLVVVPDSDGFGSELEEIADETRRDLSLDDLVCLLSRAVLFLGNDSGPGHVAAALGVRTVSIFGPQDPGLFQPFGEDNLAVIRDLCPHRPCADRCRFAEPICLTRLSADDVADEVLRHIERLSEAGRPPALLRRPTARKLPGRSEGPIAAARRVAG